jgi:hypothetical protein
MIHSTGDKIACPTDDRMVVMRCAVLLLLAAPWLWAASEVKDRAAIDKVIAALNDPRVAPDKDEIWSEKTHPMIVVRSVQFVSSRAARVDAERVQYGSVTLRTSVPVIILLEKKRGSWKVASLRDGQ